MPKNIKQPRTAPLKIVETITHDDKRKNLPTAEYQSVMDKETAEPIRVAYERRNRDLDPQLVWRGKDEQDWSDLVVHAPPIYIQEKVHPKALIEDLKRQSNNRQSPTANPQPDLFGDFNGIPEGADKTDFYKHENNWSNRMILGDSLQVMASLAEREGLRGQVQCIYIDPPYGIKFNSNFQWSTTSRDVSDGNRKQITREPEMVKAFRDTWRDGIHSYLTYLRDRLTIARDLLTESGSVFVQIGEENVHRVRVLMDEVFGDENSVSQISFRTSSGRLGSGLDGVVDFLLWYAKDSAKYKYRPLLTERSKEQLERAFNYVQRDDGTHYSLSKPEMQAYLDGKSLLDVFQPSQTQSQSGGESSRFVVTFEGKRYQPPQKGGWRSTPEGFDRLAKASRLYDRGTTVRFRLKHSDYPFVNSANVWMDTLSTSFGDGKRYVVETNPLVIQRCILMTTDPGDLVLDPTCGSGTTAAVAEHWGRRWITIDTSRVALALARARVMGTRFTFHLLADSPEGQLKEANLSRRAPTIRETSGKVRHGFVYERVPHVTLRGIANNAEISVIWETFQPELAQLQAQLNEAVGANWEEWNIPREAGPNWSEQARQSLSVWWEKKTARQKAMDASIAARADIEYLTDKPYPDTQKVRVAGPFTVESLSPHRTLNLENEAVPHGAQSESTSEDPEGFVTAILENLKLAGVQQAHKQDRIEFVSLVPWPGTYISAEGIYREGEQERRAGVFIGPEFGTVSRPDLVEAAREAGDADFDVLIACAFNFDAHSSEFDKLGRIPVLKARMNAELHMADELKSTGKGNLFVIFGEPDIDIEKFGDQLQVHIKGVDVFDPQTGEIRSDNADGIACWFIDTDYNGESFFVRHAYFLGANDPYKALKTTLKAEIDEEAWATLHSDTSRPFEKPTSGRIAVKVINHLGDEVMKVFRIS